MFVFGAENFVKIGFLYWFGRTQKINLDFLTKMQSREKYLSFFLNMYLRENSIFVPDTNARKTSR